MLSCGQVRGALALFFASFWRLLYTSFSSAPVCVYVSNWHCCYCPLDFAFSNCRGNSHMALCNSSAIALNIGSKRALGFDHFTLYFAPERATNETSSETQQQTVCGAHLAVGPQRPAIDSSSIGVGAFPSHGKLSKSNSIQRILPKDLHFVLSNLTHLLQ